MTALYTEERKAELLKNFALVQERIRQAERDFSGVRDQQSPPVELITVTKFFPAADVCALYDGGIRIVGENRDQEAFTKAEILRSYQNDRDPLAWSFIGQLQSNKAKRVVQYASSVQSVDRESLVDALGKAYTLQLSRFEEGQALAPASYQRGGLDCLIQVNLDEAAVNTAGQAAAGFRGGISAGDCMKLAEKIERTQGLRCAGLMAVAPLGAECDRVFSHLYDLSQQLQKDFPEAAKISAGMSGDLESAIRWGSTMVRVGSDIMGSRPRL